MRQHSKSNLITQTAIALTQAAFLATLLMTACSTSPKPCRLGGDISWDGKRFGGDRKCEQQRGKGTQSALFFNHGRYREFYPSGKLALEGEFKEGRKHGTWTEYSEKGDRLLIKTFDNGVQKTAESPFQAPGAR